MKLLDAALAAAVVGGADVFGGDFKAWCAVNKVPRSTAYRHKKRVEELGRWEPVSTRPRTRPGHQTPVEVEAEVVRLRGVLGADNGAESIGYQLQLLAEGAGWAEQGWRVPARATIHKILVRHGLVVAEPRKRPKSSYRRFAYARPRDCYQIDATEVKLAGGAAVVVFEVLDDSTRTLVATLAWAVENAAGAIEAARRAFTAFGVPALMLADNGTAFTSRLTRGGVSKFTRFVRDAGARLIHSSPYHPQTCGKVERHHRTFKTWLGAGSVVAATLEELQARCDEYQQWYNTQRRHSAWNCPPATAWANAPVLGGPGELPVQHDADVRVVTTSDTGGIRVGPVIVNLGGRRYGGQQVTVLHNGDHITVYTADGIPVGHLHVDFTIGYQHLQPAA
jgi:putative transposase